MWAEGIKFSASCPHSHHTALPGKAFFSEHVCPALASGGLGCCFSPWEAMAAGALKMDFQVHPLLLPHLVSQQAGLDCGLSACCVPGTREGDERR